MIAGAKQKGVTFIQGGAGFAELVAKRDAEQAAANIAAAKKFNVAEPEKLLATFNDLLKKWQAMTKDIGLDKKKFTDALMREV